MLAEIDSKYYRIIIEILNEDFSHRSFNYDMILGYSYYLHGNYMKKSNLTKLVKSLKRWKFIDYKQGGQQPFKLIRPIPYSIISVLCKNGVFLTDKQREEIVQEHYIMERKDKLLKLKERINSRS